ncbi:MAG: tetratricopeptide repeat protein [Rikenellaceae bacterium]
MSQNKHNKAKQQEPQVDTELAIENALGRTELFFEKNGKKLLTALAVVVLVITGYFGYQQFIRKPHIEQAAAAMVFAQNQFAQDSMSVALKGNGKNLGFEQIVDEFSGTSQANLAYQYMGICYLNLGEFDKAVKAFESYSTVSGSLGILTNAQNLGLTGDAYSELGNYDKAFEYYTKAANYSDNIATTPTYTFRAALVSLEKGDYDTANKLFTSIKTKYPQSQYASDIDKYIALSAQKATK